MKTKTMRKLIAFVVAFSFAFSGVLPAMAQPDGTAGTTLTPDSGGGGGTDVNPIVKVKWEMDDWNGTDNDPAAGAQFDAPGVWGSVMGYKVCAIVTDPQGILTDGVKVYADIYYPNGIAIHDPNDDLGGQNHPNDIHSYKNDGSLDTGIVGTPGEPVCSPFKEQNELLPLEKMQGYDLFCNKIFNNNNNLPKFSDPAYDYNLNFNEICGSTGELMEETALVFCEYKTLKWEDPAGMYTVKIKAQDKGIHDSDILENQFEYLPLTAFEKDFISVDYGSVTVSNPGDPHKKIMGDQTFSTPLLPTVRNLGNTRTNLWIAQDDMGLGKTSGNWNVSYDARIGNNSSDWKIYSPFGYKIGPAPVWQSEYVVLDDILDLSETEKMDFSILVTKFPDPSASYSGTMYLGATDAPFRNCQ